jgi:hypothetical protein
MKQQMRKLLSLAGLTGSILAILQLTSCNNDDEVEMPPTETGTKKEFIMYSVATGAPGGSATFAELDNNATKVTIVLSGLGASASHPAHIHMNSGAEGGEIAVSLEPVTGDMGKSETIVSTLDDGTVVTYQDLINFDGHVNVHLSTSELGTLVAQGDIGPNAFTANIEDYELASVGGSGISGDVTFVERVSGEILVILELENTPGGGIHPAHIHNGSAAVGGSIAISLNDVNGDTGFSLTDVSELDDGTSITFSELKEFEGHVKVHLSSSDLGTIVASGDIGDNVLTGEMEEFMLNAVGGSNISGTVAFHERKGGKTLVSLALNGTPDGGVHPAHIHEKSLAEGGSIAIGLNNVNGSTGQSHTDIGSVSYEELVDYDGHVKVHLSASEMATVVAAGDIGGNELTGESESYTLMEGAVAGISGTAVFAERKNGNALITLSLENTPDQGSHPAHIHLNSVAEGGGIFVTLNPVDGTTGKSMSTPRNSDDNLFGELPYELLIMDDTHIKVHLSAESLGTVVAAGDVGGNKLTGAETSYEIKELNGSGVSGTVTFLKRTNGNTLVELSLMGTPANGDHPSHIHSGSVAEPGGIIISLNNVDGNTGKSMTHIEKNNAEEDVTYDDLVEIDGHVKVHLSPDALATVVAAGDIGSNDGGALVSYATDIRPILDTNCQVSGCHGSNGSIPTFATYADVAAKAAQIKSRTSSKSMPPASSGKSLTDDEIAKIASWVDNGALNN